MKIFHRPVLLKEVLENLRVKKNKYYIDATIGGGGYTGEILFSGGIVLGIDRDKDAIEFTEKSLREYINKKQLFLVCSNFSNLTNITRKLGIKKVNGIIFDLGVSSWQLESNRGFSFRRNAPLDMRMGQEQEVKAADVINDLTEKELYETFIKFGEEERSGAIAHAIVVARSLKTIKTTGHLVEIIEKVKQRSGIHPATKVFQALRIAVNSELINLKKALPQAFDILEREGRLLVLSYHSLEDRIVKRFYLEKKKENRGEILTKKPIRANIEEIRKNPRSRSAKLRIIEKK